MYYLIRNAKALKSKHLSVIATNLIQAVFGAAVEGFLLAFADVGTGSYLRDSPD